MRLPVGNPRRMTAVLWLLAMWSVLGADARAQEPDLIVDSARMNSSWGVDWKFIPPDHCAIVEG